MKLAIVGIGNSLRADDNIGLSLVDCLEKDIRQKPKWQGRLDHLVFGQFAGYTLDLIDQLAQCQSAIIIDSWQDDQHPCGAVIECGVNQISAIGQPVLSMHGMSFADVLDLAQRLDLQLCADIHFFLVAGDDFSSYSESISIPLQTHWDAIYEQLFHLVQRKYERLK